MSSIDTTNIRIVELEPLRVVCAHGFGTDPEPEAWNKLSRWAEDNAVDPWDGNHRFFGYNDPAPTSPGDAYGYRQCMTVDGPVDGEDYRVEEARVGGGRWATLRCQGLSNIGASWQRLASWVHEGEHRFRPVNGLEELLSADPETPDDYLFDLYLPIE